MDHVSWSMRAHTIQLVRTLSDAVIDASTGSLLKSENWRSYS